MPREITKYILSLLLVRYKSIVQYNTKWNMHQNNTPIKESHPCEYCSLGAPHRFVVSICSDNQAMGAMASRITDNSADCSAASSRKHYKLEDKISILPALCKENPPVTSGSPNKGPLMLKVYYFDRNYAEKSFLGNKTFFWWPILSLQWRHKGHGGVSNHQLYDCLLNRLFRKRWKRSKLRVTGLCEGNSLVTGEFPTQRASNTENISIWWRHHVTHMHHWTSRNSLMFVNG